MRRKNNHSASKYSFSSQSFINTCANFFLSANVVSKLFVNLRAWHCWYKIWECLQSNCIPNILVCIGYLCLWQLCSPNEHTVKFCIITLHVEWFLEINWKKLKKIARQNQKLIRISTILTTSLLFTWFYLMLDYLIVKYIFWKDKIQKKFN